MKSSVSIISNRCRSSSTNSGSRNAVKNLYSKKNFRSAPSSSSLQQLHFSSLSLNHRQDEKHDIPKSKMYCNLQTRRDYSLTSKTENASLALGLGAIAATAKAGQYAVSAYKEWKDSQPEEPENSSDKNQQAEDQQQDQQGNANASSKTSDEKQNEKRENIFASFFDVGTNYYEGGFEDQMTKREAALILGVRPSSTEKRIKEAHRKLLILNHPDTGGSTFLSGKLNEAKDLLIKAKVRVR